MTDVNSVDASAVEHTLLVSLVGLGRKRLRSLVRGRDRLLCVRLYQALVYDLARCVLDLYGVDRVVNHILPAHEKFWKDSHRGVCECCGVQEYLVLHHWWEYDDPVHKLTRLICMSCNALLGTEDSHHFLPSWKEQCASIYANLRRRGSWKVRLFGRDVARDELFGMVGHPFDPEDDQDVLQVLYVELGLKKVGKGLSDGALRGLLHPIAATIADYRKLVSGAG